MNAQPSDGLHSALVRGLSACVFGLVLTPLAYLVLGALSRFAPAFALLSLPPLLVGQGVLSRRLLAGPSAGSQARWGALAELASWLVVLGFLVVVSNFTLLTTLERVGLLATCFLIASVLSLPLFFVRETRLAGRFQALSNTRLALVLGSVVLATASVAAVFVMTPARFP